MRRIIIALMLMGLSPAYSQSGSTPVFITNTFVPTYSASTDSVAIAAAATDVWCLRGSATKTVFVQGVRISGTASANTVLTALLVKRRTANTGTSTAITAVPHDSNDPAATASAVSYTTNPTVGTPVGPIRSQELVLSGGSSPNLVVQFVVYQFSVYIGKVPTLHGTNEQLCVNLNGQTVSGGAITIDYEWTEQ